MAKLVDSEQAYNELIKLLELNPLEGASNEYQIEEVITATLATLDSLISKEVATSMEERRQAFIDELTPFVERYGREMCNDFAKYFLGKSSPKARKYHFEKQKTFNMGLRLKNWERNSRKFSIVGMLNKGK